MYLCDKGDSGSPLMFKKGEKTFVLGVTSIGIKCSESPEEGLPSNLKRTPGTKCASHGKNINNYTYRTTSIIYYNLWFYNYVFVFDFKLCMLSLWTLSLLLNLRSVKCFLSRETKTLASALSQLELSVYYANL